MYMVHTFPQKMCKWQKQCADNARLVYIRFSVSIPNDNNNPAIIEGGRYSIIRTRNLNSVHLWCNTFSVTRFVLSGEDEVIVKPLERFWIVIYVSERHIASPAQETPNLAGFVIVVYAQTTRLACTKRRFLSAGGALAVLCNEHLRIVVSCQALSAKCHIIGMEFFVSGIVF
jgi:hypothetical protein